MDTKKLLCNKVIEAMRLMSDEDIELILPKVDQTSIYVFEEIYGVMADNSLDCRIEDGISADEAIDICNICANAMYRCMDAKSKLNDGVLSWSAVQSFIVYTWDLLGRFCNQKQLYMESIKAARFQNLENAESKQKPVEIIESSQNEKHIDIDDASSAIDSDTASHIDFSKFAQSGIERRVLHKSVPDNE